MLKRLVPIGPIVAMDCELSDRGEYSVGESPFGDPEDPKPIFVNPQLNRFRCAACEESGDVIAYVRRRHGLSFVDAVRYLADLVGYKLEGGKPKRRITPPSHPELNFDWGDAA